MRPHAAAFSGSPRPCPPGWPCPRIPPPLPLPPSQKDGAKGRQGPPPRAPTTEPDLGRAACGRAMALAALGRLGEARAAADKAARLEPDDADIAAVRRMVHGSR